MTSLLVATAGNGEAASKSEGADPVTGYVIGAIGHEMGQGGEWREKSTKTSVSGLPCWVPHPMTGIYYPKGHEWVMEGVPEGAASRDGSYWLRSSEGLEKPLPGDKSWSNDLFDHPFLNT
ncbi:hypothetical protein AXF42_Ash009150 [Apostasia shenzhenica]|uniref:Uncharacterized protein n=1 Tax=Apostasia shenzhenica TaxID=1088818 RepID=A0A2I0ADM9_9ASPA|nr:hypothetical protein AXF42_Ash009150 [Apostasia shenzhenica]